MNHQRHLRALRQARYAVAADAEAWLQPFTAIEPVGLSAWINVHGPL
jgi:hypothetical protein